MLLAIVSLLLFIYGAELGMVSFSIKGLRLASWFESSGWRWAIVIVGLAKVWVIAGDEMLAQHFDARQYAADTTAMGWPSNLSGHPAGFPVVAGIVSQFGVP